MAKTKYLASSDERFFDVLKTGLDNGDAKAMAKCRAALQAFLVEPKVVLVKQIQALKKIQALASVSTDFAKLTSDAFNVTVALDNFDLGYQQSFRDVPLGNGQDTWDI
jgi:hypothetical protein